MLFTCKYLVYSKRKTYCLLKNGAGNYTSKSICGIIIKYFYSKKDDYTSGGVLDRYYRLSVVVETMSSVFSSVVLECISLIAGAIILIGISPIMFYLVLVIVAAYIISFVISKQKLFKLSKTIMDKESLLITHIKETIENLMSLKSFENSNYMKKMRKEIKFVKIKSIF